MAVKSAGVNIKFEESMVAGKRVFLPVGFGKVHVLTGGKDITSYKRAFITEKEFKEFLYWLNKMVEYVSYHSKYVAELVRKHDGLMLFALSVLKGYVGGETEFGGMYPDPGQIGMDWVLPYDIYGANSWSKSLTAGTDITLINAKKTSTTPGQRAVIVLFERGLIHVGEEPALQQFTFTVGQKNYVWKAVNPIANVPVKDEGIYAYDVPAFLITQDDAVTVTARPTITASKELPWVGVIFAEQPYLASVRWS